MPNSELQSYNSQKDTLKSLTIQKVALHHGLL